MAVGNKFIVFNKLVISWSSNLLIKLDFSADFASWCMRTLVEIVRLIFFIPINHNTRATSAGELVCSVFMVQVGRAATKTITTQVFLWWLLCHVAV